MSRVIMPNGRAAIPPTEAQMQAPGKLSYLASYCPLHKTFPGQALAALFIPAINNDCVRFFDTETGATAAALIWARLDEDVAQRMLEGRGVPTNAEWGAGDTLWFLDILAPFGHGATVARQIARNPPDEPFFFARLGPGGAVRKVVEGDAGRGQRGLVRAYHVALAA